MRKASRTLGPYPHAHDAELKDARPGRIHGATITSWNGPPEVDLAALFAGSSGTTVSGSGQPNDPMESAVPEAGVVRLSDGTQITFATAGQFTVLETV